MIQITAKKPSSVLSKCQGKVRALVQMFKKIWHNTSGLTLLEVAIVLVVVGVLLAGIFPKGQRMLEQARLSKTVTEVHNYFINCSHLLENNPQDPGTSLLLSNGALLRVLLKDERYFLTLGKNLPNDGKKYGFTTWEKARKLQKALNMQNVAIITNDGDLVSDDMNAVKDTNALYGLQIPLDTGPCT